jgi:heptosyltransferase-2
LRAADLFSLKAPMEPTQERIFVRGVNWLGDAVMTTPALLRLREARPGAHIALLTPAKLTELWTHHPALDAILPVVTGENVFQVARRLRREQFDTALIFPNSPRSALEAFLARISRRVGYARPWRTALLTDRVEPGKGVARMRKRSVREIHRLITDPNAKPQDSYSASAHHCFTYLRLATVLGARAEMIPPCVVVKSEELSAVRQRFGFSTDLQNDTPLLGLNPGAEYGPAKRWPRERFIAASVEVQRRTGCRCWIFGGPLERELANGVAAEIARALPSASNSVRSLAGETSLRELCAALKACDVVITNDTGPMHVAAAVGTPVVVPFGSTSPALTAPGLPGDGRHVLLQADAPCSPCFRRECPIDFRCMVGISVEAMVNAVMSILKRRD